MKNDKKRDPNKTVAFVCDSELLAKLNAAIEEERDSTGYQVTMSDFIRRILNENI